MSPDPAAPRRLTSARRALLYYGGVALLCVICTYGVLGLRNFDPRYAYDYSGDSLLHIMAIKAVVEQGWYQHIDRLAAPGGLHLEDFPMCDNLCCGIVRFLALFTSNPFLIQNLVFLGSFPVTVLAAAWSLRRFGLSRAASLPGAMLYAMLPYHFVRGTWHLFLSAYFLIPPVSVVMWWTMRGAFFAPPDWVENPVEKKTRRKRLLGSIVICALLGCNAVYYPFFACALFAVAGLYALFSRWDWRHAALAFALTGLLGGLVIANLLPTILYVRQHGKSDAGVRAPREAEVFGLKVAQMLLPVDHHRIPALAALKTVYAEAPLVNENAGASLGFVGDAGLLLLLGWTIFARRGTRPGTILDAISTLNVAAILLGTIGGFASLFALLVSPQIRCYNRISVFIAFYALLAVGAACDYVVGRHARSTVARAFFAAGMCALTAFGIWDQTTPSDVRNYHHSRHAQIDDAKYFAQIERLLPAGAMVFQLPGASFPEAGNVYGMGDYSHVRGYVQTRTLRWSYGAVRGRPESGWYLATAALPPDLLVQQVAAAGFLGLYVDCHGYADFGASELTQFSMLLDGAVPLLAEDGQTAFYDLAPHVAALLKGLTPARREAIRHLLGFTWEHGFTGEEHNGPETWNWCGHQGDLVLVNDSATEHKAVQVAMDCRPAVVGTFPLHVSGDLVHQELQISDQQGRFARVVDVPPGQHVVHFVCDAPEQHTPGDPRTLVWQVYMPQVKDVTGLEAPTEPEKTP